MGKRLRDNLDLDDLGQPASLHLVEELQLAKASARTLPHSLTAKLAVTFRPADSDRRQQVATTGQTLEVGSRTVVVECQAPLTVGNFFQLTFDPTAELPPQLARCDRCLLLGEQRFECRLQFLNEIELPRPRADAS